MEKTKLTYDDLLGLNRHLKKENQQLRHGLNQYKFSPKGSIPFLDLIPQMVSYTNKYLCYEYVNKSYERNFNIRADEIIGKNLADIIGKDVLQQAEDHIKRVLIGEEVNYSEKFHYPNGMVKYIEGRLLPDMSESNEVHGYWAILDDVTEQKHAENALKESEAIYRTLFEAATDACILVNEETLQILDVNNVASEIYGYSRDEFLGMKVTDISTEKEKTADSIQNFTPNGVKNLNAKKRIFRYHRKRNGSIFPVEITAGRVTINGININISTIRDVTKRVEMEKALKQSEEKFRLLVEAAPISILLLRNGKYIYANPEGIKTLGFTRVSNIAGKNALSTIAPEFHETIKNRMSRLHSRKRNSPVELQLLKPNGERVWTISTSVPVIMDGLPTTIIAGLDITALKKTEKALRESERQKQLILNASTELIAYYNVNLQIIWANKAAAATVGTIPENIVGQYCYSVWHEREKPCENCPVLESIKIKKPVQGEKQTPDGRIWYIRGFPVFGDGGEVVALAEFGLDITNRKRAEAALRESEERLRKSYDTELVAMAISRQRDGKYIEANPGFLKMTGYTYDEIIGHTSTELNFFTTKQRKDLFEKLKAHQVLHNEELSFPMKNGEMRNMLFSIGPVKIEDEPCFLATMIDITDRKKSEKLLRESEYKYRKLMEEAPVGIILFINHRIEIVNSKALQILSFNDLTEFKKKSLLDIIHPDDHSLVKERIEGIKNGTLKYPFNTQYRVVRDDGNIGYITEYASEFKVNNKVYTQSIIQDITPIMEVEQSKKKIASESAYIERKLQLLKNLETELKSIIRENHYDNQHFDPLFNMFNAEEETDKHWQIFKENFESIHAGFFDRLLSRSPQLTQQDIKHCAYIKLNFETKQIATIFNVKPSSVQMSRVRLKKKLKLNPHEDLIQFILRL